MTVERGADKRNNSNNLLPLRTESAGSGETESHLGVQATTFTEHQYRNRRYATLWNVAHCPWQQGGRSMTYLPHVSSRLDLTVYEINPEQMIHLERIQMHDTAKLTRIMLRIAIVRTFFEYISAYFSWR